MHVSAVILSDSAVMTDNRLYNAVLQIERSNHGELSKSLRSPDERLAFSCSAALGSGGAFKAL
eukprot:3540273-Alexandrium_andersonii.AAC.1